jgi:hypothetical protein
MRKMFLGVVVFLITVLIAACDSNSPQVQMAETAWAAPPSAVAQASAQVTIPEPADPEVIPGPCGSTEIRRDMTVEDAEQVVAELRECDPMGEYFDLSGRLWDDRYAGWLNEASPGVNTLINMQIVAGELRPFYRLFEALSVAQRRQIMETVGPQVAAFAVWYLHPQHVQEWLLDLDWERDIAPVDLDWYSETIWPENRYERVSLFGYGEVSKIELWVRMFWKRRGEAMFEATKELVSGAVVAKAID